MAWIETISYGKARGKLKRLYERIKGPDGYLDNILKVHSLRPHSLFGHMALYKNVLHHTGNTLPKWYLELLGVYVSHLNKCTYCVDHHFAGLKRLLNDEQRAKRIWQGVIKNDFSTELHPKEIIGMNYAQKLTFKPGFIKENDIKALRESGLTDGEILEINQVVSYFNYANRTVLGLGVETAGDILGLSPNDSSNEDSWQHR